MEQKGLSFTPTRFELLTLTDPGKINALSRTGFTPLHEAVRMGDVEVVQLLLSRKADPNIKTTCLGGLTALHLAARKDYEEVGG